MSTTLPANSHRERGRSSMLSTARSSSGGQAAMTGTWIRNRRLVRQRRIRLERLQRRAKISLDALQGGGVVGFEADHDHRGGIGGSGESEAVSILHAHAVDRQDALGIGKRLRRLELSDEHMGLAFFQLPVQLRR